MIGRVGISRISLRRYGVDHHARHNLKPWPRKSNPLPHELYQSLPKYGDSEYPKKLKQTYQKYVKIYHPDISQNTVILNEMSQPISEQEKRHRFDCIQRAYETLKNPNNYDMNQNAYRDFKSTKVHHKMYERSDKFYQASNWEDLYELRFGRKPPSEEEINANKYKILIGVLLVMSLTTGLQVMLAIDKTNEVHNQTAILNLQSMKAMNDSYENFDEGDSRLQRMKRFLLWRRSGILNKDESLNKEKENQLKSEDDQVLKDFARTRLKVDHGIDI